MDELSPKDPSENMQRPVCADSSLPEDPSGHAKIGVCKFIYISLSLEVFMPTTFLERISEQQKLDRRWILHVPGHAIASAMGEEHSIGCGKQPNFVGIPPPSSTHLKP
jgi:hypothetical protein